MATDDELTRHPGYYARITPDKPAVVMGSGATVSYRQLDERSARLAQLLAARGLREGDHIAILMENQVQLPEVAWAAQRAGLVLHAGQYWINESDIVICSDDAQFFDPHVTYGLTAALEPIGLARRVPLGEALRIALTGLDERVSAARALQIGLVTEIVDGPSRPSRPPPSREPCGPSGSRSTCRSRWRVNGAWPTAR